MADNDDRKTGKEDRIRGAGPHPEVAPEIKPDIKQRPEVITEVAPEVRPEEKRGPIIEVAPRSQTRGHAYPRSRAGRQNAANGNPEVAPDVRPGGHPDPRGRAGRQARKSADPGSLTGDQARGPPRNHHRGET